MRRIMERFAHNRLFVKMFLIMVISIIAVSITTTLTTLSTSERVFMNTFSITNSKIIGQIRSSLDSFNYSVVLAANRISQSGSIRSFLTEGNGNSLNQYNAYYNITQQIKQLSSSVDSFDITVYVSGVNGRSYVTDYTNWPLSAAELRQSDITKNGLQEPRRLYYQYDDAEISGHAGVRPTIVATKGLIGRGQDSLYGMMYFVIQEQDFRRFYSSFTSLGNDVAVMNSSGMIVSSNREELIGQPSPELLRYAKEIEAESLPYKDVAMLNQNSIIVSAYMPDMDFYIINLINKDMVIGQLADTKTIVLSVSAIVLLAVLIVFVVSRRMTNSLTRLVKQISNISKYEFDHYVTVGGSYETRQLAEAFNAMLDELQDYVQKLVQTQKQRRNAELEALQQQINPHFLYNTLASVKFMVQQGSKEKAAETINSLISLLQNAIGDVSETITVSQELVNMKNYVFINHVRYGERIKVNYFIAPDCMGYHMPKLMVQPFIENAFFHGFNRKTEGHIYIMIASDADALVCEIVDNGDGMEASPGSQLPSSKSTRQLFTGIGVKNVHERIRLLYGETYGVTITSQLGEGTQVKIRIPLLKS
jgi:two-component system sensor histidine kinase YesM